MSAPASQRNEATRWHGEWPPPPGTWCERPRWHRPRFYRYKVATPGARVALNRYGWQVIGVCAVVGRFAYCVKFGWAK